MSRFGAAAGWFGHVLSWIVILGISALLLAAVLVPRIAGATPYTILTGSMQPKYPPGTMVVVKPKPIDEIGIGEVITYQLESGEPTVVTHRVVSVGINGKGERLLTTQGDANNAPDAKPVMPVQVKGVLWYSVPYIGHLTNRINSTQRDLVLYGAVSILFLYAGFMFTSDFRDRRRTR